MSEQYETRRRDLIAEVLRSEQKAHDKEDNPIRNFLDSGPLKLADFAGKYRDHNWWTKGIEKYWKHITNEYFHAYKDQQLDINNGEHHAILELAAECRIGLTKENTVYNQLTNKTKAFLGWIKNERVKLSKKQREGNRKKRESEKEKNEA